MEKVLDSKVTPVDENHRWYGKRGYVKEIHADGTRTVFFQWFGEVNPGTETLVMSPDELRDVETKAQEVAYMTREFERYGTE